MGEREKSVVCLENSAGRSFAHSGVSQAPLLSSRLSAVIISLQIEDKGAETRGRADTQGHEFLNAAFDRKIEFASNTHCVKRND